MHNAIKGDKNLELKARWEQKTDSVITRNIVRDRISDMKKRAAADLKSRKAKLAQLLASEDQQYEKEFMENLETPEVKKEFAYLYQYGINLIGRNLLDEADAKEIVTKGLIERTGKTPEEFDAWLGY